MEPQQDHFLRPLDVAGKTYRFYSLAAAAEVLGKLDSLPVTLRILLENQLRQAESGMIQRRDLEALASWSKTQHSKHEISYFPARVLMQDFTGVPAIVDLAAMRDALAKSGGDPEEINPQIPVDLVIDHSVMVDHYAADTAFEANVALEMERNRERYAFLRWGQKAFRNFRVVPPGTGICHQVNLEYLARTVWCDDAAEPLAYFDTLVGTDSHTTMINGLGVLGWGVGGIEAEAAMLGQPISMRIPDVVGVRLQGHLSPGVTATDLVLRVTEMLRQHGVVGKFVEFFGPGLDQLPLADRATIANMAPEYGATCGFFPVDHVTIDYLRLSGRSEATVALAEAYARAQGVWRDDTTPDPLYSSRLELDLASITPALAGPRRPQDRVELAALPERFSSVFPEAKQDPESEELQHGDVVIAAITSCTNTSNPAVMLAAGILAQKAVARGISRRPWVKSSLAPGSKVVTDYLAASGLQPYLDQLGFQLVGYGCTTCIGNSGPLDVPIAEAIRQNDLTVSAVLSGNRNFEGRIHPLIKANWLASPPLVVAFALAGTTSINLTREPLATDAEGKPVYLHELWPTSDELDAAMLTVSAEMFRKHYAEVFRGDETWRSLAVPNGTTYVWDPDSTYVKCPSFFDRLEDRQGIPGFEKGRILALLGDSITTDHISPAGNIRPDSPAGRYLQQAQVPVEAFNSYGSRRGNHDVMVRGTFANIRLRNEMVAPKEGGFTRHWPSGDEATMFDAAMRYADENVPLVVVAGKEYGTGSSRDWAAKGTLLLGVKVLVAESFERIHRSNLVGMGILPLQFPSGVSRESLDLDGSEEVTLKPISTLQPGGGVPLTFLRRDGRSVTVEAICRIDTADEVAYYRRGGILNQVLFQKNSS
ncbi:MAG: aconitate hydratase AcnA [Desulfuromonas sp.]|nr:MAG: aconitate hydratase AcnA [Desulfuromonas sp.]